MESIQTVCLFIVLTGCCIVDVRYHRIPNKLIAAGMLVRILCLVADIFMKNDSNLIESAGAMLVFAGVSMLLYLPGMIGAGDVKLLGMTGFYIGMDNSEQFLMGVLVVAGLVAAGKLIIYGRLRRRMSYLWTYLKAVYLSGQMRTYEMPGAKEEVVGLAVPVLGGVVYWYMRR